MSPRLSYFGLSAAALLAVVLMGYHTSSTLSYVESVSATQFLPRPANPIAVVAGDFGPRGASQVLGKTVVAAKQPAKPALKPAASALDQALINTLIQQTLADWQNSGRLKGQKGDPGQPGPQGPSGAPGFSPFLIPANPSSNFSGSTLLSATDLSGTNLSGTKLTVSESASFQGTLSVSGAASLATTTISSLTVSQDLTVQGNLTVTGSQNLSGALGASSFTAASSTATSTFAGAVGIGTTSPVGQLTIGSSNNQWNLYSAGSNTMNRIEGSLFLGEQTTDGWNSLPNNSRPSALTISTAKGDGIDVWVTATSSMSVPTGMSWWGGINSWLTSTEGSVITFNPSNDYPQGKGTLYGVSGGVDTYGSINNIAQLIGGTFYSYLDGPSNNASMKIIGVDVTAYQGSNSTKINDVIGARIDAGFYGSAGAVNVYGAKIALYKDGSGTADNGYGVYISNTASSAVKAWNIYSSGVTSKNYFEGLVGIGTTSPVAKLSIQGTSTTASLPLLTVASSSGASLFTITPAGNVGIGIADPQAPLDVDRYARIGGTIDIYHSSTYRFSEIDLNGDDGYTALFHVESNGTGAHLDDFANSSNLAAMGSGGLIVRTYSNAPIIFATNGYQLANERMRITSGGNVGIGTTSPYEKLSVAGGGVVTGSLSVGADPGVGPDGYVYESQLVTGTTTSFSVNYGGASATRSAIKYAPAADYGYVTMVGGHNYAFVPSGINSKTSHLKLIGSDNESEFSGTGDLDGIIAVDSIAYNNGGNVTDYYVGLTGVRGSAQNDNGTVSSWLRGVYGWTGNYGGTVQNQAALFADTNSGNASTVNNFGLYVANQSGVVTQSGNTWNIYSAGAGRNYFGGNVGIGTTTPAYLLHVYRATDGDVAAFRDSNGTCTINPTSTALVCSSDARLKKDVQGIESALEKINRLRSVSFHWLNQADEQDRFGFIAQEVEAVIPELVTTNPDGYKSVAYSNLIPFLTRAIQEQQTTIDNLQLTVDRLQGNVSGNVTAESLTVSQPVTYEQNIIIKKHLYLSEDSVGEAKILAGNTAVRITFKDAYRYQPIVTITPVDQAVLGYVAERDATGFTIKIENALATDVTFAWHAFASETAKLTVSDGTSQDIILVVPEPTVPPTASATDGGEVAGEATTTPESEASTTPESAPVAQ